MVHTSVIRGWYDVTYHNVPCMGSTGGSQPPVPPPDTFNDCISILTLHANSYQGDACLDQIPLFDICELPKLNHPTGPQQSGLGKLKHNDIAFCAIGAPVDSKPGIDCRAACPSSRGALPTDQRQYFETREHRILGSQK